jgi:arsenate reductase-like glutaredoxin family protein
MAAGELRRFSQRFGASTLADVESKAYRQAGLAWLSLDDEQWAERLLADQRLLRLPLVRAGSRLAVGDDEVAWRELLSQG